MINRILTLIYKEILAVWRDKKSRFVLIVPPILQLLIFAYAATLDVKDVPIAVLNRDGGGESFELIQRFHGSHVFRKILYLEKISDIKPIIDNKEAIMVIHFDSQFSKNIKAELPVSLQLILDGRKSNTAQIVQGYASQIIQQFNQDILIKRNIPFANQGTEIISRNWYNPNLLYYWFNVPNLSGILTMLIGLTITGLSIARERELGTFDQLLVSPLQPIEILIGKTVPALVIGLLEGTIVITTAIFYFQIPFTGSLLLLYLSMFVFISSIIGIGLFISSLSMTQQQAILGSFVFMTPAVLLSGFATPIENMPYWLQEVTLFNPLRYYLVIAKGIFLKAMPTSIILENIWPMALIAVFTLTGASLLFRKKLS
ncbi:MAG: ABC transporter permease [Parachlamydiaceae bacterium]|nr:ABC transporter permease [Parachlamydiaceae bacterium]